MRAGRLGLIVLLVAGASAADAQTRLGADIESGLPWHVAALQGASWSLVCRFKPVTYEASTYNKEAWANRIAETGRGSKGGRLPSDNGSCTVTKTGGRGAVAIAMIKNGESQVAVTTDPARPAAVGFF
ncbi:hypothetical protein [Brevundimonas sp. Root1423]|uniref:hypothetical protein n=1 Tax=Brevundimonas sp. Root1423 TaxID=1736462 RepID=UPI0006FED2F4|nr:hypothetical protein [Brevundimonas sp. Root1423]KQY75260.1 hypothetical protein ASD25_11930 [Brevundimonas sp. Root1423]